MSHTHTQKDVFSLIIQTKRGFPVCNLSVRQKGIDNYVTSEGAVSHNVLYYQQLPITRYQVRFNAIIKLPIVSSAFTT